MAVEFLHLYDETGTDQTGTYSWAWWDGQPLTAADESGSGLTIGAGGTLTVPVTAIGVGYLELKNGGVRGLYRVISQ